MSRALTASEAAARRKVPLTWRRTMVAVAALAVPLAAAAGIAPPASASADASPAVTATIPVGGAPYGVNLNLVTGTAYVANTFDGTVSVISG